MYIWHQFSSRDEYTSDHEQKYLRVYTKIYLLTTIWTWKKDVDCASTRASIAIVKSPDCQVADTVTIGVGHCRHRPAEIIIMVQNAWTQIQPTCNIALFATPSGEYSCKKKDKKNNTCKWTHCIRDFLERFHDAGGCHKQDVDCASISASIVIKISPDCQVADTVTIGVGHCRHRIAEIIRIVQNAWT